MIVGNVFITYPPHSLKSHNIYSVQAAAGFCGSFFNGTLTMSLQGILTGFIQAAAVFGRELLIFVGNKGILQIISARKYDSALM